MTNHSGYPQRGFDLLGRRILWLAVCTAAIPLVLLLFLLIQPWRYLPGQSAPTISDSSPKRVIFNSTSSIPEYPASTGPTTSAVTSTGADPTSEAAEVTNLLDQAHSDRQAVLTAVNDAMVCGADLAGDAQVLQTAQSHRQALAQSASQLPVDALDAPAGMASQLAAALSDSATADGDFAAWAQTLESSCTKGSTTQDPNYQAAYTASGQANQAKKSFVAAWNSIAPQYNQPTWSDSDI